ncbi:MAG: Outer rane cobalamin receptor translocator, tonB dependent, partial [Pseudomonadota bacterium]
MTLLGVIILILLSIFLHETSAEEAFNFPEMVIVGPSESSVTHQLDTITDINRTSLAAVHKADMNGALRGLASVGVGQINAGSPSSLVLRGASGGLGLVNLDGIPLFNNFTGFFALSHYPLDLLDRVGVTRGQGGDRYSSRTLGGSINLFSKQMENGKAFLHTEGGSYGTVRTHLGGGVHNNLGHWTVAGGRTDIFEGISQASPQSGSNERDNSQMSNGLLHWDTDFNKGSLDSSLYFVRSRDGSDGPGLLPNHRLGWKDDPSGLLNQETWVAQTHGNYRLSDNWDSALRMGFTQDQQTGRVGTLPNRPYCCSMDLTSQLWLGHWENTHPIALSSKPNNTLRMIWGIDAQQQHGESTNNALTNTLVSPLARAEIEWGDWLASTEIRNDHYDQFGNHAVFNTNVGWHFYPDMMVWAKGGTGYRAPAVNERLHPLFGSANLVPESNAGGEMGWRWKANTHYEVSTSSYIQRYHNLIVLQQIPSGSFNSLNINQAHVWGVELQGHYAWNEAWNSGLAYSYMVANN